MREAKFILPMTAGQGAGHEYARSALLRAFGGYTFHKVEGAWQSPSDGGVEFDESIQYIVAINEGWVQFRAIALQAGRLEHQQAVYIVSPTGEAEIVNLPHHAGKSDRIVQPNPELPFTTSAVPHLRGGDLWRTADNSVVRIVEVTMGGRYYGRVLDSAGSASVGASIAYTDDGKVDMLDPGPHPLHLKRLLDRNQG